MKTLGKTLTAVCLAASFLVASIYCCCFSFIQLEKQKHGCCPTKASKNEKSSKHDCPHCNSSFKADLATKDAPQSVVLSVTPMAVPLGHVVSHVPILVEKSLFINGPPGPIFTVPLYIQNHTLRI